MLLITTTQRHENDIDQLTLSRQAKLSNFNILVYIYFPFMLHISPNAAPQFHLKLNAVITSTLALQSHHQHLTLSLTNSLLYLEPCRNKFAIFDRFTY